MYMRRPLFVRPLSEQERSALIQATKSGDGFSVRRAHILLASARGMTAAQIHDALGCAGQTVRNALRAFDAEGLDCLVQKPTVNKTSRRLVSDANLERLRGILHKSPRLYGKDRSLWTLRLIAEVAKEQQIAPVVLSEPAVHRLMKRLNASWTRAKNWITSPDSAYDRKKTQGLSDRRGNVSAQLGDRLCG